MVGHSIGGIYVRKYADLYPTEVIATSVPLFSPGIGNNRVVVGVNFAPRRLFGRRNGGSQNNPQKHRRKK